MIKPLIACAVGALAGMLIALWAIARYPVDVTPSNAAGVPAPAGAARTASPDPDPASREGSMPDASDRNAGDVLDVLDRARTLADRADVRGLMALRDDLTVRAQLAGVLESEATKRQVAAIDRELARARASRLALDRDEFRKAASTPASAKP